MIRFGAAALFCAAMGAGAATLSGTVRTAATTAGGTAAPVEGAKVVLIQYSLTGGGAAGAGQTRLDSTTTDAQGQYTFAKADTGIRLLSAEKAGYQNATGLVRVASDTGHYTANLTLRARPETTPGFLKVTVLAGSAQGTPVAGATLVLSSGFAAGGARADTVKADDKGQYLFKDLAPAGYSLRVSATGFQARTAAVTVRARDTAAAEVILLPENATGAIAGKVVKASDGSAVSGAKVIVSRGGILGGGGAGGSKPDTVTTGSDGAYKVDSVPAQQTYTVTVKADGYQTAAMGGISVVYNQTHQADFFLVPAIAGDSTHGSVAGMVEDTTHKGLAGVRVILTSGRIGGGGAGGAAAAADTVETDAQGRFVFPKLTAGNYRLTAALTGYQTLSETGLNVAVGETFIATLTMRRATAILAVAMEPGGMRLSAGPAGRLILSAPAAPFAGRVRVYDARGALRFAAPLAAGATHLDIPWVRGRTGYVVVERGGEIHRLAAAAAL
jgi:hypothetical protein